MAEKKEGYRKLEVYEKAYRSAVAVYRMTADFPKEERYGMTDQMRRASVSIALNVAEGYARRESQEELKRFLRMAAGSAAEMQVLIEFAKEFGYVSEERYSEAREAYEAIGKMLNAFIRKLKENTSKI